MISDERLKQIVADTEDAFQREVGEMARELISARKVVENLKSCQGNGNIGDYFRWIQGVADALSAYNAAVGE